MITYVQGDATSPIGEGVKVIVHICNDIGGWGRGFVLALSAKWPEPEFNYRNWFAAREAAPFKLGMVQFVRVEEGLFVANLIGQHKIKWIDDVPPIRYEAVHRGLMDVVAFARLNLASVHMPRIGCGLAGGTWDRIEPIIQETLVARGVEVFVYDLPS
jgi:O-acetyl-ADP-ribose deacetylase (regulator of RNase III)